VSEDVELLIRDHRVRSSTRRWESRGYFAWDVATVLVGELQDGRWYVERLTHTRTGPYRAQAYPTEQEALAVAGAVQTAALGVLDGDRSFVEVDVVGG
jgi:hypothetical protein